MAEVWREPVNNINEMVKNYKMNKDKMSLREAERITRKIGQARTNVLKMIPAKIKREENLFLSFKKNDKVKARSFQKQISSEKRKLNLAIKASLPKEEQPQKLKQTNLSSMVKEKPVEQPVEQPVEKQRTESSLFDRRSDASSEKPVEKQRTEKPVEKQVEQTLDKPLKDMELTRIIKEYPTEKHDQIIQKIKKMKFDEFNYFFKNYNKFKPQLGDDRDYTNSWFGYVTKVLQDNFSLEGNYNFVGAGNPVLYQITNEGIDPKGRINNILDFFSVIHDLTFSIIETDEQQLKADVMLANNIAFYLNYCFDNNIRINPSLKKDMEKVYYWMNKKVEWNVILGGEELYNNNKNLDSNVKKQIYDIVNFSLNSKFEDLVKPDFTDNLIKNYAFAKKEGLFDDKPKQEEAKVEEIEIDPRLGEAVETRTLQLAQKQQKQKKFKELGLDPQGRVPPLAIIDKPFKKPFENQDREVALFKYVPDELQDFLDEEEEQQQFFYDERQERVRNQERTDYMKSQQREIQQIENLNIQLLDPRNGRPMIKKNVEAEKQLKFYSSDQWRQIEQKQLQEEYDRYRNTIQTDYKFDLENPLARLVALERILQFTNAYAIPQKSTPTQRNIDLSEKERKRYNPFNSETEKAKYILEHKRRKLNLPHKSLLPVDRVSKQPIDRRRYINVEGKRQDVIIDYGDTYDGLPDNAEMVRFKKNYNYLMKSYRKKSYL